MRIRRYNGTAWEEKEAALAEEIPFTIHLNGEELATLLCSPAHLEELATGFLVSAGLLRERQELLAVRVDAGQGTGEVTVARERPLAKASLFKRYVGSGCGGGAGFYNLADVALAPVSGGISLPAARVPALVHQLQEAGQGYRETRGIHTAALADASGLRLVREDIGRHNAVDKLLGRAWLDGLPAGEMALLVTGRISSELLLKAARLGTPMVISRSVPTSLAVAYASQFGITLVGSARAEHFNVYCEPQRIT